MVGTIGVVQPCVSKSCGVYLLLALIACPVSGESVLQEMAGEFSGNGGLAVFLDCDDFSKIAGATAGESWLVHCLYRDPETVAAARDFYQSRGIHGRVTADSLSSNGLPYVDNLVNVLVVGDFTVFGRQGLNAGEIARCLAPRGKVCLPDSPKTASVTRELAAAGFSQENGPDRRHVLVKPYPGEMDEWTHYMHSANGNAVSQDSMIGVSRHLRWATEPLWARHHDFTPSVSAMVTAGGRIFYIIDEAPPGIAKMPGRWSLVARDAFNGVLLWKRPVAEWGWTHWTNTEVQTFNRQKTPSELTRRLVAVGEHVYVTLGYNAPVSQINAATGEVIQRYGQTRNTSEILHHNGRLILSVNAERQKVVTPGDQRPIEKQIIVLDPESGDTLWRKGGYAGVYGWARPERNAGTHFICAGDHHVFFLEEDHIVCLNLADGAEAWRIPRPAREKKPLRSGGFLSAQCALVYHGQNLFFGQFHYNPQAHRDGNLNGQILTITLWAVDAESGKIQWQYEGAGITCTAPPDVFINRGLVWIYKAGEPTLLGLDTSSGKVVNSIPVDDVLRTHHHHRCYGNKATARYILTAKEGIEYTDIESGRVTTCHWVRGVCRYGIMPANGLIYAPPHQCGCFIDAKLNGFLALTADPGARPQVRGETGRTPRFQPGPAYDTPLTRLSDTTARITDDWPMYRKDAQRSGFAGARLSDELEVSWEADIGGNPTGVTAAGKKIFLASRDTHLVYCLDADSGDVCWKFTPGGRVDTPPTCYRGRVLFGSHDGSVYCLRATDGQTVWQFRAAPKDSRLTAFGRLESPWPVHGSVLVLDGRTYFTAGRSAHLNSGIYVYCLDAETGRVHQETRLSADLSSKGELQRAALSDVLVSDGRSIWMRKRRFDARDIGRPTQAGGPPPLNATAGLLDESWFNRTFWTHNGNTPAQYLVFDDETVYGIRAYQQFFWKSFNDAFEPGRQGYQLFAADIVQAGREQQKKDNRRNRRPPPGKWSVMIPIRAQAMVVTDNLLFAAGVPDVVDGEDPWAAFEGRSGALLCVFSKSDGRTLAQYRLPVPPTYDGMAVAEGRLYLTLKDGKVICFAGRGT